MGGSGSGGHNHNGKPVVENCLYLDASSLKRGNALGRGIRFELQTPNGFSLTASNDWNDGFEIDFYNPYIKEQVTHFVGYQLRRRHFGGTQAYLVCPACQERQIRLYLWGRIFRCRCCNGLQYTSQRNKIEERLLHRARKVAEKLNHPNYLPFDDIPSRPKGMHRVTYERLAAEIEAAMYLRERCFGERVLRLFRNHL